MNRLVGHLPCVGFRVGICVGVFTLNVGVGSFDGVILACTGVFGSIQTPPIVAVGVGAGF